MPSETQKVARSQGSRSTNVPTLSDRVAPRHVVAYVQYRDDAGHCRCDCDTVDAVADTKAMPPCRHIMAALVAEAELEAPEIANDLAAILEYVEGGNAYADRTIYSYTGR